MSTRGTTDAGVVTAIPRSIRPVRRLSADDRLALMNPASIPSPTRGIDAGSGLRQSARPISRPNGPVLAASRTPRRSQDSGGTCGRNSIQGTRVEPVKGAGACGIADPVRITGVGGVALSRPTRMNCTTARALDDWVQQGVLPTIGRTGGGAVALQVAAGYSCRTRNSQAGAKLSEHSKGNAIDISAIELANGERLTVLDDWGRSSKGQLLRRLWVRACGPFGTVLGPESDRFHRDHFHFDVASYRSGPYCR